MNQCFKSILFTLYAAMSNRKDEEQHSDNSTSSCKKTPDSRLLRHRNNGKFALVSAITAVAIGLIALLPATTITSIPTTAIDNKMIMPTTHAAFAQQEQHQSIPATKSTPSTPPKPSDQPAVANQYTFNPLSKPPNTINGCVQFGKELVGKSVPDYNLCDLIVYRQAPAVTRSDGMIMNNYSGMGHYIELIPAQNNINQTQPFAGTSISNGSSSNNPSGGNNNAMTNASNVVLNNNTIIVAFGEFSLLDPEVVPVHKVLDKYNWTITTIHNHMLDESPKLLFMHWTVTGKAGDIVKQAKEAIMQTSTYSNSTLGQRVPSSAGP